MKLRIVCALLALLSLVSLTFAQTSPQTASALPRLVRFGGTVKELNGNALAGVVGITFALYSEKTGGAPLWLETQNATADATGHYTVLLGSTKPEGLPAELFTTEQARWVGVQVSGQPEQPRVLLVSAPYALKAGDAETIGGLPPSAFVLAAPPLMGTATAGNTPATVPPPAATDVTTTGGTLNYLPIFSGANTIIDSAVFQTGSGTTAKVGINTTTPVTQLDVNGAGNIRGTLSLPATGNATAAGGKNSQGLNLTASSFSSTSSTAQNQVFRLQAESAANDTTAPSGTLNLQYGLGATAPSETGFKISSKGIVTFAAGQTFPGTAELGAADTFTKPITFAAGQAFPGTLTAATAASPLTATTTAGKVSLGLNTTALETTLNSVYPQLKTGNVFASYLEAYQKVGPGNAAVYGWGSNGSVGTFGASDTGYGLEGRSTSSGFGVYAQTASPGLGSAGVLGFTGTNFSTTYSAEAAAANAGIWADNSAEGTGIPVALFATADVAYAGAFFNNGGFPALFVHNLSGGAVEAEATSGNAVDATTTSGTAVSGITSGGGDGVEGFSSSLAPEQAGVLGVGNSFSNIYNEGFEIYSGIWGDTGTSSTTVAPFLAAGVIGTADDANAGIFLNNSATYPTMLLENYGSGGTGAAAVPGLFATLNASTRTGACGIGGNGDLTCTGQLKTLATTGGGRTVETYAMHSPENWMEDFGSGALQNGVAVVNIDPAFAETVSQTADYHVFITPNGDSKGLYVIRKTAASFEVRESSGGTSSLSFDYRIVAKRRGLEAQRLTDVTERFQAEQKAADRRRGTPVRQAVRPAPSPLLPKPNAKPLRRTVGLTPQPHAAVTQPALTRPAPATH